MHLAQPGCAFAITVAVVMFARFAGVVVVVVEIAFYTGNFFNSNAPGAEEWEFMPRSTNVELP